MQYVCCEEKLADEAVGLVAGYLSITNLLLTIYATARGDDK
jgi:hypothetical protein